MFASESLDDTLDSVSLGDSDNIEHFRVFEDAGEIEFFFEQSVGEFYFVGDGTSVNLDFHDVIFLLSLVNFLHLGGGDDSDDCAVFFDSFQCNFLGIWVRRGIFLVS
jgi:hypothetical protein